MTATSAELQVVIARAVATIAHHGQTDKLGEPYIDHPRRVAERLEEPLDQAIAWLHDVLEDTAVTEQDLLLAGVRPDVLDRVRLLTRRSDVSADDYYERIRQDAVARRVKLADIADNTAPWRTARLDAAVRGHLKKKYTKARAALGASEEGAR